ncbi:MAG: hypothetical protein CMI08_07505 [Oceanospirillaceae bacterium]|uniref:hypothetical protein n=1 Tax=unclassified Thalassolituus TaxID=2624967 RepID=UPI000C496400|nr:MULTISPECIES: hypothetical protein [unclassified Thalassolituus]MAS26273.1 hypothetical protein [Oceanospirillaceae bacterium]MAX99037.1 hypothetical protein [Oceanospirillaceae bacterium]MBS53314.1 hypothetical protein [Oceanospirillaceae bacterium]|tara:strand:+ start:494 stop:1141 length:648 start_codon:yes stop_codon:yes gene_type:complete
MAKNPNPKLPNEHTLYVGKSGTGKSQALKQNSAAPGRGVRCLLWDESHDHDKGTTYYDDKNKFINAVKRGVNSGRGFRIGWDGDSSPESFEWWAAVVWAVLDGKKPTYVVIEELAQAVETVGRAAPNLRKLFNQGRKYGARIHAVTQRPQEIPKTVYDQCGRFWIGGQKGPNIKKFAELLDVPLDEVRQLMPLQFWYLDETSGQQAEKHQLKYKN